VSTTRRALKYKRDHRRAETELLRTARREALKALLSRARRGVALSGDEAALLSMHVEAEIAEGDAARASERGQQRAMDRHRQTVEAADAAIRETEQRAEQAEAELAVYREIEEQHRADPRRGMMQRTVDHYRELAKEWEAQCHRVSARLAEQRKAAEEPAPAEEPADDWPRVVILHQTASPAEQRAAEAQAALIRSENAREELRRRLNAAEERARVATAAALALRSQTPGAAQRTLALIRQAGTWGEVWVHLGIYYGMKPEEAGLEARKRRTAAERRAEAALAEGLAAVDRCEAARDRYRDAWKSARRWANHHAAARKLISARMQHAVQQAAEQAVQLEDANRALWPVRPAAGAGAQR
jgi:hypothetical protein